MNRFKLAEKLGFDPPFVFEDDDYEIEYFEGRIYYDRLGNVLKQRKPFLFDYNNFVNDTRDIVDNGMGGIEIERPKSPLVVTDDNGVSRTLSLSGKLNIRLGSVQVMPRKVFFDLDIDVNSKITYTKKIKYQFLDEEAIILETPSYTDYELLSQHIGTGNGENVKQRITKEFNEAFRKGAKDTGTLKWLYDQAPQFVITQRDDQTLLSDLRKLITYDLDSWFIDSTTAIMKILIGFENTQIAFDHFYKNPQEIIEAYRVINDVTQREAFTTFFSVLSLIYTPVDQQSGAEFIFGKDYALDSNLFVKKGRETVLLQQLKSEKTSFTSSTTVPGFKTTISGNKDAPVPQTQTEFHPLALVTLKDQDSERNELVCALQVKHLSDKAEWDEIVIVTTFALVTIGILASAGVLASGATGLALVIASVELVVGIGDLIFLIKRANLDGTEEGDWFIDHWEEISIGVGVLSIGTALHQGFLRHGPRVLGRLNRVRNATAIAVQKRITQLLTEIQIELYFFFKQGIVLVSFEPFSFFADFFGRRFGKKMQQFGVWLTTPIEEGSNIRAIVYQGENIAEGTKKELKATLGEIFPHAAREDAILNNLENILKRVKTGLKQVLKRKGKIVANFTRGESLEILTTQGKNLFGGELIELNARTTKAITGVVKDVRVIKNVSKNGVNVWLTGINIGGLDILSSPRWFEIQAKFISLKTSNPNLFWKKVTDEFWETVNKPWVDEIIKRGDDVRFVSDPKSPKKLFLFDEKLRNFILDSSGNRIQTIFSREVDHLLKNGYKIVGKTAIKTI